ncbi:MAG: hypothetical protein J0M18_05845 [Ignavibacteria bacterium]|nr:hypothetical protein [Ignavibacteria bacterium]
MKNFRMILSLLPVLFISVFIYFLSTGFFRADIGKAAPAHSSTLTKIKTSGTVFTVHLTDSGSNHCLSGNYTYCVNGGLITSASGDFQVELECNEYTTICVQSSSGCKGTWTGYVNCEDSLLIIIDLMPNNEGLCDCMH